MRLNKKCLIYIFIFLLIFVISFCYICFEMYIQGDEVWNYGFSYNIANGLVPYRDFNMVITPLYSFMGSIFIKIFGSYLYSLHILNAILISVIVLLLFKIIKYRAFIIFPFLICYFISSYNFLSLFWLFIIIYLCNYKNNDNLIGLIISLLFLTKQTVGLCLFIPYFLYSKNKIKSLCMFFIPIFLFFIYLIYNNALFNFVDYCFLGMFDFGSKNTLISIWSFIELGILLVLLIMLFKCKFKNKELVYILFFQIMAFPIFDFYHFFVAFIPIVYLMVKNLKARPVILGLVSFLVFCLSCDFNNFRVNYIEDNYLKYRAKDEDFDVTVDLVNKYRDNDKLFLFLRNAYAVKLLINEPINKYDLINDGNMGYDGANRYIKEIKDICNKDTCIFIVDNELYYPKDVEVQTNQDILEYVYSNFEKIDNVYSLDVLSNYK